MKLHSVLEQPLVSVIIPVYKVEAYLMECVESVRNQTLENIEIILVDDGSPDGCPQICDNLADIDNRIRVVHKENEGLGLARNTGLSLAKGKWVMFVDSDDFIALNALEYLVGIGESIVDADQVRFLKTDFFDGDDIVPHIVDIQGTKVLVQEMIEKLIPLLEFMAPLPKGVKSTAKALASAWSAIYRREVLEISKVVFESERVYISEDYVFNIEFAAVSRGIVFTPERFYFVRTNPGSLTRSLKRDRIERSVVMCEFLEKRLSEIGVEFASYIAMGCMLVYMRAHNNHIFDSNLPLMEKRQLFYAMARNKYIGRIASEYEFTRRTLKPRIIFSLRKHYFLALILTRINNLIKGRS